MIDEGCPETMQLWSYENEPFMAAFFPDSPRMHLPILGGLEGAGNNRLIELGGKRAVC